MGRREVIGEIQPAPVLQVYGRPNTLERQMVILIPSGYLRVRINRDLGDVVRVLQCD